MMEGEARYTTMIVGCHQWSGTPWPGRLTRELQSCSISEHHGHCCTMWSLIAGPMRQTSAQRCMQCRWPSGLAAAAALAAPAGNRTAIAWPPRRRGAVVLAPVKNSRIRASPDIRWSMRESDTAPPVLLSVWHEQHP